MLQQRTALVYQDVAAIVAPTDAPAWVRTRTALRCRKDRPGRRTAANLLTAAHRHQHGPVA
jgi:hypothetical protein